MVQVVNQLRGDSRKANDGKDRKPKIPQGQTGPPAPGVALGKVGLSNGNHGPVSQNGQDGNPGVFSHPVADVNGVVGRLKGGHRHTDALFVQTGKVLVGKAGAVGDHASLGGVGRVPRHVD